MLDYSSSLVRPQKIVFLYLGGNIREEEDEMPGIPAFWVFSLPLPLLHGGGEARRDRWGHIPLLSPPFFIEALLLLSAAEEGEEEKETTTYGKRKGLEESKKGPRIRKYDKCRAADPSPAGRIGVSGERF